MGVFRLISRRELLKGAGVSLALPLLETMGWAEPQSRSSKRPVRLAFLYFPMGVYPDAFWPKDARNFGPAGELPPTLEPLRSVLGECLLLDGIHNRIPWSVRPSPGHGMESSGWLTGVAAKGGGVIYNATSADQLAAQRVGQYTVIPSLELGTQPSQFGNIGENGYNDAYKQTVCYSSPTQPLPVETSPRAVFKRLFSARRSSPRKRGGPVVDRAKFNANGEKSGDGQGEGPSLDRSMLDLVMESARDLKGRVSRDDGRKIDEYLDGVRSLEKRVEAIERQQVESARAQVSRPGGSEGGASAAINISVPDKDPTNWQDHLRLLADLMVLAFQGDVTRIVTLMFSKPYGRSYPELGISETHHDVSHHDYKDKDKIAKLLKIERYNVEQLAYIIQRMKSVRDGDRSLLDNSIMLWGSGMGEGAHHRFERLPAIVAGRGGGTVRPGRYVQRAGGNQCDLLMGILARAGVALEQPLGDGTKLLPDLS